MATLERTMADHNREIFRAVSKLATAALQVGLAPDDLIRLLNEGMTVAQLLEYIVKKSSGECFLN